jgi:hypothetical protein
MAFDDFLERWHSAVADILKNTSAGESEDFATIVQARIAGVVSMPLSNNVYANA